MKNNVLNKKICFYFFFKIKTLICNVGEKCNNFKATIKSITKIRTIYNSFIHISEDTTLYKNDFPNSYII